MYYSKKIKTITLKVKENNVKGKTASSSRECYEIAKAVYKSLDDGQEHFTVFFMTHQNNVIGYKTLFSGGQTTSMIDIAVLFRNVLLFGATSIIICHNHPSQNTTPSVEDKKITAQIKEACKLFGICLLDHLILGDGYFSFADEGILRNLEQHLE